MRWWLGWITRLCDAGLIWLNHEHIDSNRASRLRLHGQGPAARLAAAEKPQRPHAAGAPPK